ncbi:helix-turn-helix domain-containing protein [Pseudomonas coronafaciens]|uniref:helix-turn-helix domain-containing protein n=1 Tax=Pseudomonas coronafaciens TaxID=53409 RepID=UPI0009C15155
MLHQRQHLALLCKIGRSYMERIERGEVRITIEKLFQISECLECDPACLLPLTQEAESGHLPPVS